MKKICRSFDTYRLPQDALEILENGIYDWGGYKKEQKKYPLRVQNMYTIIKGETGLSTKCEVPVFYFLRGTIFMKKNKSKKKRIVIIILIIIAVMCLAPFIVNKFGGSYSSLQKTDKQLITEFAKVYDSDDLWKSYGFKNKTILVENKASGHSFLLNAKKSHPLSGHRIDAPYDYDVYRVPKISVLNIGLPIGNFNSIGKKYSYCCEKIYFVKVDNDAFTQKYSSGHFIVYLTHEAFHYYMQSGWKISSGPDSSLSSSDLKLLGKEYEILAGIQTELASGAPSKAKLKVYAKEYVSTMHRRIRANKNYMAEEMEWETAEGTANYVSIKAAKLVGYDYGVMYFDNVKNVSFNDIMPMYKKGKIKKSMLSRRIPYESGALLCQLCEALDIPNWQDTLNKQTTKAPVYLLDVIEKGV